MKSLLAAVVFIFSCLATFGQYYYKDILGAQDLNQMFSLYKSNNVASVRLAGYDEKGKPSSDFSENHYFFPSSKLIRISTKNNSVTTNQYFRFNSNGSIASINDTTYSLISATTYNYDEKGTLVSIKNTVTDKEDSIYQTELHQWFYNETGKPVRMLKIMNSRDTTDVRFTIDDKGNVSDEWPFINRLSQQKTYYYYDDQNRMTDIVRYNFGIKKMLPDFMFQYSDQNQVSQKMTALSTVGADAVRYASGIHYLVWQYSYNDKGLKTKEITVRHSLETGQTVSTGKILYTYTYSRTETAGQ